ncbi:tetratricopeptide repeat protein [Maritimibacter sp. DP1N21-5]|nr:tetratricopeptide repeat protein [Maritimibacter sp. DP1N21-5]MBV7410144.1 tetratricopeptide repeat protein [Maritimibacter sp. DP1N21-5]
MTDAPPTPTATTTDCAEGTVWDETLEKCVAPKESRLDDDGLYEAARELAYAGRLDTAGSVLSAMSDQSDDRVLTYRGFIARQMGDIAAAEAFYLSALAKNPGNLLARSYMGQGLVAEGRIDEAYAQLVEIRRRGGADSWPAQALDTAIRSGVTTSY